MFPGLRGWLRRSGQDGGGGGGGAVRHPAAGQPQVPGGRRQGQGAAAATEALGAPGATGAPGAVEAQDPLRLVHLEAS